MRGAWKTVCEYIFELHTQRKAGSVEELADQVGCDGFFAHVIVLVQRFLRPEIELLVHLAHIIASLKFLVDGFDSKRQRDENLFVNIRWYHETDASSF